MSKDFSITAPFKVKSAEEENGSITIEGYANTTSKDRVGDIVLPEAWTKGGMNNYVKNPIVLAFHDHKLPVGEVVDYSVDNNGLHIVAEISKAAGNIYELVKSGILKAFSVGFALKDAEYDREQDTFFVKDLELHEISVVSIPANADAIFSLRKSFNTESDYTEFRNKFIKESSNKEDDITKENDEMTPEEIKAMVAEQLAAEKAAEKAAADEKAKEEAAKAELTKTVVTEVTSGAQELVKEIEKRFEDETKSLKDVISGLESAIQEKSGEIEALHKNKMRFTEKGSNSASSVSDSEIDTAIITAKILGRPVDSTDYVKSLIEKAGADNPGDHVASMTADWEQSFSTRLHNDLRERLVIEPLFSNRMQMNSYTMNIPTNPDAGTAEWIARSAFGTSTSAGSGATHTLGDTTITAYKLASKEYIAYEEEEDAIIPIVPVIRDAIVRRMSRSMDIALLRGQGSGSSDPITGLGKLAADASAETNLSISGGDTVTAATLQTARRNLGAYGLNPADVVYVVSKEAYYDLLDDPDFRTVDVVGANATILRGQIGSVNGSPVIVSGEFEDKAATKYAAIAAYMPNFLLGTLRGMMVERDKDIEYQRNVIVTTTRLGMVPLTASVGASVVTWIA